MRLFEILCIIVLSFLLYGVIFRDTWVTGIGIVAGIITLIVEKYID